MDPFDPMMLPEMDVLGLGPDPRLTPPPKPDLTRKPDKTRDLVRLALTGLALGLGPGRGTGLAAGLSMADQQYRQDQRLREQDALRQYQSTYNDWQQQARAYQQEADRRGQMLVKTLDNLAADIEGTRSSEDAERVYQMYGQALTAYGFRGYDAESLKRKIKSPDRKARAMKAVDAFLKNPAFKSAYEQDPESVSQATVEVDGVPVTLAEAMEIAGSGMVNRETGKAITPRTTPKADTRSLQVQAADALARGDNAAYNRLLQTEREFAAAGRAPAGGGAGKADRPKQIFVLRNGVVTPIEEGTAQPGDRPYNAADAKMQATAQDVTTKRQTLADNAIQAIDALIGADGMSGIFGAPALMQPGSWTRIVGFEPVAGTAAADAKTQLDRLLGLITLPELQNMRGLGAMSDREFATISRAATTLNTRMSDRAARAELARLRAAFEEMRQRQVGTPVGDAGAGAKVGRFVVTVEE